MRIIKLILFVVIATTLLACSNSSQNNKTYKIDYDVSNLEFNKKNISCSDSGIKQHNFEIIPLSIPSWFAFPPQGKNISIALAMNTNRGYGKELSSKLFAANQIINCQELLVELKISEKDNGLYLVPMVSEKNFIGNPDSKKKYDLVDKLSLIESKEINTTFLSLLSEDKNIIYSNDDVIFKSAPTWYKEIIKVDKDFIYSYGHGQGASIVENYQAAFHDAIKKLGNYLPSNIISKKVVLNSSKINMMQSSTNIVLTNIINSKNAVIYKQGPFGHDLEVYIELKWKKGCLHTTKKE